MAQKAIELTDNLIINGHEIHDKQIQIFESVSNTVAHYKRLDKKQTLKYLRSKLNEAVYLGEAFVGNLRRPGHIVQIDELFYLAISNDLKSIFHAATHRDDFDFFFDSVSSDIVKFDDFEVDLSKLSMTTHFLERSKERFNMNSSAAKRMARDVISQGTYICITHPDSSEGKPTHMFCKDNVVLHLALDLHSLVTIYSVTKNPVNIYPEIHEHLVKKMWTELNKAAAEQKSINRSCEKKRLLSNLRIAEIELELFSVRKQERRDELEQEHRDVRRELREEMAKAKEFTDRLREHALALATFI